MEYIMTFLEGIISFVSPCMLPILPIYISCFAGKSAKKSKTFFTAASFVAGFTLVFCILGLFAGSIGYLLNRYHTAIDIVSGVIVIFLGLNFIGLIKIPFFKDSHHHHGEVNGIFSAFIFGIFFSVSHAPCMIAFLGTALVTASSSGSTLGGLLLLLAYSLGIGIPFLVSALLIEQLNSAFSFIKRHYGIINLICGILLILLGICLATGLFHHLSHMLTHH